ncbi:MAG: single-stranded-DNA-specific exonuclease RecJ [Anaerolineaceae bacterium]|nr:single-stranded-DNA-specific exonuclease RecJ [Anaerolineaceae bacterium]
MFPKTEWMLPIAQTPTEQVLDLADGNQLVAAIYSHYGIQSIDDLQQYQSSLNKSTSPSELPDIDKAITRTARAIQNQELIAIWGDFDADGQTSTTILVGGLQELGANVIFHIPVRGPESHGINLPNLQKLFDQEIKLLITCDTGIREFDAALACKKAGVDFIITDHHTPADQLPEAIAVVSGQLLPEEHNLHNLCGAGCAYKFIEALFIEMGFPEKKELFIDLAAIGTVADLVPLTLENRRIVRQGLAVIQTNPRPALAELLKLAEIAPEMLQEEHIGFQIAPRMNALGRLGDANAIVPFFLSQDATEIRITASRLDGLNLQRKQLSNNVFKAADEILQRDPSLLHDPVLVLHHPSWPAGINGLVASQLTERYHKPTIVLTVPVGENARGSARSIEGINITDAIASQESLLDEFGGHAMAAGLSLAQENLSAFRKGISKFINTITAGIDITAKTYVNHEIKFSMLTLEAFEKIDLFSPFGPDNPAPVFLTKQVSINQVISLSKEKQHLKLECEDHHGNPCTIFWWNGDQTLLPKDQPIDMLYHARPSSFRGQITIQCTLLDFRLHTESVVALPPKKLQIIDRRRLPLGQNWLTTFLEQPDCTAWGEGTDLYANLLTTRAALSPAKNLLIATIPGSFNILYEVIYIVQPTMVTICSLPISCHKSDDLISRCIGLIKYAITNKNGNLSFTTLESFTGASKSTIQTILNLLQAQGYFSINANKNNEIHAAIPGKEDKHLISAIKKDLINQISETNAFRNYYQSIQINILSQTIEQILFL